MKEQTTDYPSQWPGMFDAYEKGQVKYRGFSIADMLLKEFSEACDGEDPWNGPLESITLTMGYKKVPPKSYEWGMLNTKHLIEVFKKIADTLNYIQRQLIDAGSLKNFSSGLKLKNNNKDRITYEEAIKLLNARLAGVGELSIEEQRIHVEEGLDVLIESWRCRGCDKIRTHHQNDINALPECRHCGR